MKTILFACPQNASRARMAAAFFNALAGGGRARALAAGTDPVQTLYPDVARVMAERELDLKQTPTFQLDRTLAAQADLVIAIGGRRSAELPPGKTGDWLFADPAGQPLERIREIRDEIERRVRDLLTLGGWSGAAIVT